MWGFVKTKIVHPIVKALGNLIKYQANDPSTPDLAIMMQIPVLPNPCPPFAVQGFTGSIATDGSLESQANNVYITIVLSLTYVQSTLQRQIIRWPALTKLIANPRAGKMFNAYYDRYYLNFFYDIDPKTGATVYTCDSTDVVSHELGHAILDSIRPDLWAVQCVEIQSFHEAFGDINAITMALNLPDMVKKALSETNNDLRQSNVISRIAEQMGQAIQHVMGKDPGSSPYLRSAINTLQYAPPETLPTRAPDDQLAGEPHSFSRVFSGAWYDSLINIYNAEKITKSPEEAIVIARDKLFKITINGIRFAQINARFYNSVLRAMLSYDAQTGLGCGDHIRAGFAAHNLRADAPMMLIEQAEAVSPMQDAFQLIGTYTSSETARIADFVPDEHNPLHQCIVELAKRHDPAKFISDMGDLQEAITAAKHSLKVIAEHDRVGHGPTTGKVHDKEFTVIDGRLMRNYFCCACRR
jgi:hypothetical protein